MSRVPWPSPPSAGSELRVLGPAETPLTLAAQLDDPAEMIKALRNGGAHLDFRARDGMTALHKAARARNQVALKVHSGARLTRGGGGLPLCSLASTPVPCFHPMTAT